MKCLIALISFTIVTGTCTSSAQSYLKLKSPDGSKLFHNRMDFFKEYAFCSCLSYSYSLYNDSVRDDSKVLYEELSDFDIAFHTLSSKIDKIVKTYVDSLHPVGTVTYLNRKPIFLDCMSFYKSRNLRLSINCLLKIQDSINLKKIK